ncbi:MAG: TetR/AcrR family transcriptional regulator [Proteobacteria bacterium]|nr:TetR/AcrR family transcriptional regulator [Pseudomonadota bacterium]MBI3496106.1 TetR/AcrR family transcriptional regulator [Pseudomonadota bacterium]
MSKDFRETALQARITGDDFGSFVTAAADRCREDTSERKQDRSKRREQEILRAAIRVFARDGISRARIGDVAAEAGMPVSSIYEYYQSKEDLAYAVPASHLGRFFSEYAEAAVGKKTAWERLRLYLWLAADFARRNPEWARMLYLEIWPSVMIGQTPVRKALDDYVRVIVYLLRQGAAGGEWQAERNPYEMAAILTGSVNQVIITWLLYRKPSNLMKAVDSMIERVMTLLPTNELRPGKRMKKAAGRKG